MNNAKTNSGIAHIITLLCGFAVSFGLIDDATANELSGYIITACGVVGGIITIYIRIKAKNHQPTTGL